MPKSAKTSKSKKETPKPVTKKAIAKPSKSKSSASKGSSKEESKNDGKKLMTLYGYWRSGASWRVRLCLFLKGFELGKDIEYIPVNLVTGEQKTEGYAAMNPAKVRRNV